MNEIISLQLNLRQALPEIYGSTEYKEFTDKIERIDKIIDAINLDKPFIMEYLEKAKEQAIKNASKNGKQFSGFSYKQKEKIQKKAITAFRCSVVRALTQESFRKFHLRLADSTLLQWFTRIETVGKVRVPSKSQLERNEKIFTDKILREVSNGLLKSAMGLTEPIDLELSKVLSMEDIYMDSTCIPTNIHYPVDWVLFRDAIRTLMKSTIIIRSHGLKHRMEDPKKFIKKINKLCIEMSHQRRKKNAKRERKRILRLMKKLLVVVEGHALRHRNMLENQWEMANFSEGEVRQILSRMDNVLVEINKINFQAHERIIGERRIKSEEKLLSLYEKETNVIIRKKQGAEIEYGNSYLLAEQEDGLIVDWKLYKDKALSDTKLLKPSLERIKSIDKNISIFSATTDRGFCSSTNNEYLEENEIKNFICPRSVKVLEEKLKDKDFCSHQERRGQTEGRIGIFKNNYLGAPLRSKGFENRNVRIGICVVAHNLWTITRIINQQIKRSEIELAS